MMFMMIANECNKYFNNSTKKNTHHEAEQKYPQANMQKKNLIKYTQKNL